MVEPGYTPPPIETSSTPLLGGPGTVFVSSAVASKTIVSERSIPEAGVEGEDETPSKVMLACYSCFAPACSTIIGWFTSMAGMMPFLLLFVCPLVTSLPCSLTCSLARCVSNVLASA